MWTAGAEGSVLPVASVDIETLSEMAHRWEAVTSVETGIAREDGFIRYQQERNAQLERSRRGSPSGREAPVLPVAHVAIRSRLRNVRAVRPATCMAVTGIGGRISGGLRRGDRTSV